jgi:hypothetical protein
MHESMHAYTLTNKVLVVVAAQALPLQLLCEQHKKNYDSHGNSEQVSGLNGNQLNKIYK